MVCRLAELEMGNGNSKWGIRNWGPLCGFCPRIVRMNAKQIRQIEIGRCRTKLDFPIMTLCHPFELFGRFIVEALVPRACRGLTRLFHTHAPNLAHHLAGRRLSLLHRITADTLLSSEPSGDQSLTRSSAPVYEICGLTAGWHNRLHKKCADSEGGLSTFRILAATLSGLEPHFQSVPRVNAVRDFRRASGGSVVVAGFQPAGEPGIPARWQRCVRGPRRNLSRGD